MQIKASKPNTTQSDIRGVVVKKRWVNYKFCDQVDHDGLPVYVYPDDIAIGYHLMVPRVSLVVPS